MTDKELKELIKGQSPLDRIIFQKKNDFFYKTSDDILYKGDLGNKLRYFEIFQEFSKKSKMKPIENPSDNLKPPQVKSRNLTNTLLRLNKTSSINAYNNISNSTKAISSHPKINIPKPKPTNNSIGLFKKSQSSSSPSAFMGNSMANHLNFIKHLDNKIQHLDEEIERSRNQPHLQLPSTIIVQSQSRIIDLFLDYFDSKTSRQIKTRYRHLYGNEDYFTKIKAIKYSQMNPKIKRVNTPSTTRKGKEKKFYIRVMNDYPFQSDREVVLNKYDSIGKVKILNIPREFYNHKEILSSKEKVIDDNVSQMYSTVNRNQRKINSLADRFFYSIENKRKSKGKRSKLLEIKDEFSEVERRGRKIKKRILDVKHFFSKKSPIVNQKILAFVNDPLELYMKNNNQLKTILKNKVAL